MVFGSVGLMASPAARPVAARLPGVCALSSGAGPSAVQFVKLNEIDDDGTSRRSHDSNRNTVRRDARRECMVTTQNEEMNDRVPTTLPEQMSAGNRLGRSALCAPCRGRFPICNLSWKWESIRI